MDKINPLFVKRVYVGQRNRCMCGCKGRYSENPRQIRKIVNVINDNIDLASDDHGEAHIYVELGDKIYVAYCE